MSYKLGKKGDKMQDKQFSKQKAVALRYNSGVDSSPKVIASGEGLVANRILEKAKEADVAIYEDKELVEELTNINLGANIPPALYEVVAQILIFADSLDKKEMARLNGND